MDEHALQRCSNALSVSLPPSLSLCVHSKSFLARCPAPYVYLPVSLAVCQHRQARTAVIAIHPSIPFHVTPCVWLASVCVVSFRV